MAITVRSEKPTSGEFTTPLSVFVDEYKSKKTGNVIQKLVASGNATQWAANRPVECVLSKQDLLDLANEMGTEHTRIHLTLWPRAPRGDTQPVSRA
jgi:type IV pilus biogenesis protein CpaD/CtpE